MAILTLRRYKETDDAELKEMLKAEDVKEEDMSYDNLETYILEDDEILGFFSIKTEWDFPSLQHFVIKQNNRSPKVARALIRFFVAIIKLKGIKKAIIHVSENKKYLNKFVRYFFRVQPYAFRDDRNWYLVTI